MVQSIWTSWSQAMTSGSALNQDGVRWARLSGRQVHPVPMSSASEVQSTAGIDVSWCLSLSLIQNPSVMSRSQPLMTHNHHNLNQPVDLSAQCTHQRGIRTMLWTSKLWTLWTFSFVHAPYQLHKKPIRMNAFKTFSYLTCTTFSNLWETIHIHGL